MMISKKFISPFKVKWKNLTVFHLFPLITVLLLLITNYHFTAPLKAQEPPKDNQKQILVLYSTQDLTEEFSFKNMGAARVSRVDSCGSKCTVKFLLEGKIKLINKVENKVGPGGQSPASIFCRKLLGLPLTFHKKDLSQIEVCLFQGGDMILSWDLHALIKNELAGGAGRKD